MAPRFQSRLSLSRAEYIARPAAVAHTGSWGSPKQAANCDTVISIPNEKLLGLVPKGTSFMEALRLADDVLRQAVQHMADIITTPGVIIAISPIFVPSCWAWATP